jgi:replicative DNA helicase
MNDRLPPHDIGAEEAVSGSLLIDGRAIYEIAVLLQPPDFYNEQNRWIYQACLALYERDEAINQITVAQEMERKGHLEAGGGVAYLSHLISIVPTSLDVEHYARIVYRLSVMRQLISAADRIAQIGYEADPDVDSALGRAEDALYKLRSGRSSDDLTHISRVLDRYFEVQEAPEPGTTGPVGAVMSSFDGLDQFLDGFQRSDLVIVAGRPSMGKTSLALNIARNAAVEQGACVALFSLEMSRESLVQRLLSSESGVNLRKLRFEHAQNEADERKIFNAMGVLSEVPIYVDDTPLLHVVEMRSKARRLHMERGLDMIIVDYLQLMQGEGGRNDNRVQEISYISRSLKALARELNVPVIAASQLSRAVEWRSSHRPQLSDLRESGSIEQDADVVLLIYRDDYYFTEEEWRLQHPEDEYPEGIAQIIVGKHRNGPTGELQLRFVPRFAKFENLGSQQPSQSLL